MQKQRKNVKIAEVCCSVANICIACSVARCTVLAYNSTISLTAMCLFMRSVLQLHTFLFLLLRFCEPNGSDEARSKCLACST